MSISVTPTFSASNTRESGISCCTSALVVVLPAPWVPLIHTITGSDTSARWPRKRTRQNGIPRQPVRPSGDSAHGRLTSVEVKARHGEDAATRFAGAGADLPGICFRRNLHVEVRFFDMNHRQWLRVNNSEPEGITGA